MRRGLAVVAVAMLGTLALGACTSPAGQSVTQPSASASGGASAGASPSVSAAPRPSASPSGSAAEEPTATPTGPIWWDGPDRSWVVTSTEAPTEPGVPVETHPSPTEAPLDGPEIYQEGCIQRTDAPGSGAVLQCSVTTGSHRVVLTGASHAIQFYPALRELAAIWDWELLVVSKEGCRFALPDPQIEVHHTCAEWNAAALPVIEGLEPELVITVGSVTSFGRVETVNAGELAVWRRLANEGIDVAAIRDTPRFTENMPECVAAAAAVGDPRQCGRPRAEVYAPADPVVSAASLLERVYPIDVADLFCGERWCPAVVGGVLAYRDASHVTKTYAATLMMPLRDRLDSALPAKYTGLS